MEKFAEELPELRNQMAKSKGLTTYVDGLKSKCEEEKAAGNINVSPALLLAEDNKQIAYEPCATILSTPQPCSGCPEPDTKSLKTSKRTCLTLPKNPVPVF